jgi:putative ABC transport system ATP-binding protein
VNDPGSAVAEVPVIFTRELTKVYGTGANRVEALKGIDLTIRPGEFVAIMGPSGSGKSTLLHVLGCLHKPTDGKYELSGEAVEAMDDDALSNLRNRRIGVVFQKFNLLAKENIVHNTELPLVYGRVPRRQRRGRAVQMLEALGLGDRLNHRPAEMSGGQDQRVAIARALVNNPDLVLADEPTGNLDSRTGAEVMALFRKLHEFGRTIVLVTHDTGCARHAERIIHILDGRIERIEEVGERQAVVEVELALDFLRKGEG